MVPFKHLNGGHPFPVCDYLFLPTEKGQRLHSVIYRKHWTQAPVQLFLTEQFRGHDMTWIKKTTYVYIHTSKSAIATTSRLLIWCIFTRNNKCMVSKNQPANMREWIRKPFGPHCLTVLVGRVPKQTIRYLRIPQSENWWDILIPIPRRLAEVRSEANTSSSISMKPQRTTPQAAKYYQKRLKFTRWNQKL